MAETREFNQKGLLKRLTIDNRDRLLTLQLENLSRQIPANVASVIYQELNAAGVITKTITKTRKQLLNAADTYSFIFDFIYYPGGEINTIQIRTFDASAPPVKLDDKTLKHYLDGTQPEYL